jgi:hypothetical protein
MIDTWTLLFSLFLIVVGLGLVSFVRSEFVHKERPGNEGQTIRQQTARALRQMEWRRGRIWWKMDEAYAEFVKKSAIESRPARLLPEKVTPQVNQLTATGEEEFALTELQTAYEVFLGKDSPITADASYAATPNKQFESSAR